MTEPDRTGPVAGPGRGTESPAPAPADYLGQRRAQHGVAQPIGSDRIWAGGTGVRPHLRAPPLVTPGHDPADPR